MTLIWDSNTSPFVLVHALWPIDLNVPACIARSASHYIVRSTTFFSSNRNFDRSVTKRPNDGAIEREARGRI